MSGYNSDDSNSSRLQTAKAKAQTKKLRAAVTQIKTLIKEKPDVADQFAHFLCLTADTHYPLPLEGVVTGVAYELILSWSRSVKIPESALFITLLDGVLSALPGNVYLQVDDIEGVSLTSFLCVGSMHEEVLATLRKACIQHPHEYMEAAGVNSKYKPDLLLQSYSPKTSKFNSAEKVATTLCGFGALIGVDDHPTGSKRARTVLLSTSLEEKVHFDPAKQLGIGEIRTKNWSIQLSGDPLTLMNLHGSRSREHSLDTKTRNYLFSDLNNGAQRLGLPVPRVFGWQMVGNEMLKFTSESHKAGSPRYIFSISGRDMINKYEEELDELKRYSEDLKKKEIIRGSAQSNSAIEEALERYTNKNLKKDACQLALLTHLYNGMSRELVRTNSFDGWLNAHHTIPISCLKAGFALAQTQNDHMVLSICSFLTLEEIQFDSQWPGRYYYHVANKLGCVLRSIVSASHPMININYLVNELKVMHYTKTSLRCQLEALVRPEGHHYYWGKLIYKLTASGLWKIIVFHLGVLRADPSRIGGGLLDKYQIRITDYSIKYKKPVVVPDLRFLGVYYSDKKLKDWEKCYRQLGDCAIPPDMDKPLTNFAWQQYKASGYKEMMTDLPPADTQDSIKLCDLDEEITKTINQAKLLNTVIHLNRRICPKLDEIIKFSKDQPQMTSEEVTGRKLILQKSIAAAETEILHQYSNLESYRDQKLKERNVFVAEHKKNKMIARKRTSDSEQSDASDGGAKRRNGDKRSYRRVRSNSSSSSDGDLKDDETDGSTSVSAPETPTQSVNPSIIRH